MDSKRIATVVGLIVIIGVMLLSGESLIQSLRFGPSSSVRDDSAEERLATGNGAPVSAAEEELLAADFPNENRLRVLLLALRVDADTSRQLLRTDFVERIPRYSEELLPFLKIQALRVFLSQLSATEWEQGKLKAETKRSAALSYLENLSHVNRQLGKFLELSLPFFFRLDEETRKGLAYQGLEDMGDLQARSFSPELSRPQAADLKAVFQDLSFQAVFEEKRCLFTSSYLKRHPESLAGHLKIIEALNPRLCDAFAEKIVLEFVLRMVTQASDALRTEMLREELTKHALAHLTADDAKAKEAVAKLFLTGAVDKIKASDYHTALEFVSYAEALAPRLRDSARLRAVLLSRGSAETAHEVESGSAEEQQRSKEASARRSLFAAKQAPAPIAVEQSSFPVFAVLLLVVGFVGIMVVVWHIAKRFREQSAGLASTFPQPASEPEKQPDKQRDIPGSGPLREDDIWGEKPDFTLGEITKNRAGNE